MGFNPGEHIAMPLSSALQSGDIGCPSLLFRNDCPSVGKQLLNMGY